MTPPRLMQMGAVELVELGAPGASLPRLGDLLSGAGVFLADALATVFNVLADIVAVPANILVSGVDVVFENVAGVLGEIPVLGDLAAQALLAAGAILKFGIQVPGMLLTEVANLFEGLSKALDEAFGEKAKDGKVTDARKKILDRAPKEIKGEVESMLSRTPTSGSAPSEGEEDRPGDVAGGGIEDVARVAVPAALAVGAVAILAT